MIEYILNMNTNLLIIICFFLLVLHNISLTSEIRKSQRNTFSKSIREHEELIKCFEYTQKLITERERN